MKQLGPKSDRYYTDLAQQDYYLKGGEPQGVWWGKGASKLRLSGTVDATAFSNLFQGMNAAGDQALVRNAGESKGPHPRQTGWDLVFSAPKSVSVVWSHAHERERDGIQKAHLRAVQKALQYIEQNVAATRRGAGGKTQERCGLVAALFEHGTSRALDPQLHTHAVVLNLGVTNSGFTGAIVSKAIYQHKMLAGALYRTELARELLALGYELRPDRQWFEIVGVPERMLRYYSKRRTQIEKVLNDRGLETAAEAAAAAIETRPIKELVPPRSVLFETWKTTSQLLGFVLDPKPGRSFTDSDPTVLFSAAIAAMEKQWPSFTDVQVKTTMLTLAQATGLRADKVLLATERLLQESDAVVRLGERDGQATFTTPGTLESERDLLSRVTEGAQSTRHAVNEDVVDRFLNPKSVLGNLVHNVTHHATQIARAAADRPTTSLADAAGSLQLNDEQRAAVKMLTSAPGQIQVLTGSAGTGKTRALSVCNALWERAGLTVIGIALGGKAALELKTKAGIPSMTIAMFDLLTEDTIRGRVVHAAKQTARAAVGKSTFGYNPLKLTPKTVLVIDEAAMLGTRQLLALVKKVQEAGAKLVLVGDDGQLKPLEQGRPFAEIGKLVPMSTLATPVRLADAADREAAQQIRAGEAADALKNYKDRGRFFEAPSRDSAITRLVADWGRECIKRPNRGIILCSTNSDADSLNNACQQSRLTAGRLRKLAGVTVDGVRFLVGDRVLFTLPALKRGIVNGQLGTITSIGALGRSINVRLDDGRRVTVPALGPFPFGADRYRHKTGPDAGKYGLKHGYAITTHRAQGSTFDRAFVLLGGGMQDRELTYVQVTRAKEATFLYTDHETAGYRNQRLISQMSREAAPALASTQLNSEPQPAQQPAPAR